MEFGGQWWFARTALGGRARCRRCSSSPCSYRPSQRRSPRSRRLESLPYRRSLRDKICRPPGNLAGGAGSTTIPANATPRVEQLPSDFAPWWQDEVLRQLRDSSGPLQLPLDHVILGTLMHSAQVRIVTDSVQIQRTAITQAAAGFDPRAYMQTNFINTSDPVGSLLTTGGASRFIDQNWNYTAGIKQRLTSGAQVDLSNRLGYQDNNSIYFVSPLHRAPPRQRSTSRNRYCKGQARSTTAA